MFYILQHNTYVSAKAGGNMTNNKQNTSESAKKAARDNRSNQLNPNNSAYHSSRKGNSKGGRK